MHWKQLIIPCKADQLEMLEAQLYLHDCAAITLKDAEDNPIFEPKPGELPLWDEFYVEAIFEQSCDTNEIAQACYHVVGSDTKIKVEHLEDRQWERAWLDHFKPMQFGDRIWICPTAFEPPEPNAVNIFLDPGLAFGTGTHPTTALCLTWLAGHDVKEKTLLDYGCGSGILAIAALKAGAKQVVGVDIDPQALIATQNNAELNTIPTANLPTYLPDEAPEQHYDIVMANILQGPLIELAPRLVSQIKPEGFIVLSGLLHEQVDEVIARYTELGIAFKDKTYQEDWACLVGRRLA